MRRKWILMLAVILVALTGCTHTGNEAAKEQETAKDQETDGEREEPLLTLYSDSGSVVLEDEKAVYLCAVRQIRKMDKESRDVTILWESGAAEPDVYTYAQGNALLVGDNIYFIENCDQNSWGTGNALSMIGTDGTGYRRLDQLENSVSAMYHFNDAVYVYFYRDMRAYEIGEDGALSFSAQLTENVPYQIPEGYRLVGRMTPFESVKNYGYILLETENFKLAMIDPQTGEETVVSENHIEAMNEDYFLFSVYNAAGNKEYYLQDAQTLETKLLAEFDADAIPFAILKMDENYVYFVRNEEEGDYSYERISLENGECSGLFAIRAGNKVETYTPYYLMDFTIRNGYIYYIADKDYAMYLMRRNVEHPDVEEVLGEPYFDKGIGQVGRTEFYYEAIYSQVMPEVLLGETDLEKLVIDEKFPGASQINRVLNDYQENCIFYEREGVEWMEEELEDGGEEALEMIRSCSYRSRPSQIFYFDGDYFSFYQSDDDYMGGAHGMLYRCGYTFDLKTGGMLSLTDLIRNSEEELKEIVTKYYARYIEEDPEKFWDDALETVNNRISLDSDFYLSEKGICFYFEPYALACFAAGFQEVTIPYEEFEMKLPLGILEEETFKENENPADDLRSEAPRERTEADHEVNGRKLPIYCVDTKEKKVALTFDAAWGNEDTEAILEILKQHDIHATFFMTGGWVESYPDDVKAILALGHDLGNHSENHRNMSQLSDEEKTEEIMKVHERVKELTGYEMFLFRPPYGDYDNAVVDVLGDCGYYAIQWDVDSLDWQNKGIDSIIETVTGHRSLGNGSIILCHNGAEYTAAALDTLIDALEEEGYEIVPLSELIYRDHYHLNYEGRQIKNESLL